MSADRDVIQYLVMKTADANGCPASTVSQFDGGQLGLISL